MEKNDAAGFPSIPGVQPQFEETLDPDDWTGPRELSHQIIDDAVDYLRDVRSRPVWRNMPKDVNALFEQALPRSASPAESIYHELAESLLPYPMGNVHPRFWAWYIGGKQLHRGTGRFPRGNSGL